MATKPSKDAERLEIVQRTARYVLARSTVGATRFGAMDIFPIELPVPKNGTPDYAWRQQLAWTWAKAGYLHQAFTGTGLQKRRIYTMLAAGREALERIGADPALASFYIPNKRTAADAESRPPEFFQPPELVRALVADRSRRIVAAENENKGLRLVSPDGASINPIFVEAVKRMRPQTIAKALAKANERDDEETDAAPEPEEHETGSPLRDMQELTSELRGLPVFFERITSVLERMNDRLMKVETASQTQSAGLDALLDEAEKRLAVQEEKESGSKTAPVTRDEIATALAEVTQAFLRDNPHNVIVSASLKKHEDFHVTLAREVANLAASAKKNSSLDEVALAGRIADTTKAAIRTAVTEEVSHALTREITKLVVPMVRNVVSEEFGSGVSPVIEAVALAEQKFKGHADALALSFNNSVTATITGKKDFEKSIASKIDYASDKIDARVTTLETSIGATVDKRVAAHVAIITKIVDDHFETLTSSVEKRLSALAPDVNAVRKLSEKLEGEIRATCGELKESLAAVSDDAAILAERVEAVVESFDAGHEEFKRQGAVVVANFTSVTGAADTVLEAAGTVAREMIVLARLRAMKEGASYEETIAASGAAIATFTQAENKITETMTALGGGLIKQHSVHSMVPNILPAKEQKKKES